MTLDEKVDISGFERRFLTLVMNSNITPRELAVYRILEQQEATPDEIMNSLREIYHTEVPIATFYLNLRKYSTDGNVKKSVTRRTVRGGREPHVYELTPQGRGLLAQFDSLKRDAPISERVIQFDDPKLYDLIVAFMTYIKH